MMPWLFNLPWAVFAAWWAVRAFSAARSERVEAPRQRATVLLLTVAGAVFLIAPPPALRTALWSTPPALWWIALALEAAGVAFAIVARESLGTMWSGRVTLKQDHRLVQSGPYRFVRHPIYTGVLLAIVGVVIARATPGALAGFALIAAGLARKMAAEEALLREHFGAAYDDYRRKVAAIIPFIL